MKTLYKEMREVGATTDQINEILNPINGVQSNILQETEYRLLITNIEYDDVTGYFRFVDGYEPDEKDENKLEDLNNSLERACMNRLEEY